MNLSTRLQHIADTVPACGVVADIGTDHGYLPIELVKSGKCRKAYAMDVNQGPLDKAAANISRAKEEVRVETILSDGLANLPEEVDVIVIAGMGGMLIGKILEAAEKKLNNLEAMVLSPHLDDDALRKAVHRLGFAIVSETMVEDQGKYYTVMKCEPGNEAYTDLEYEYGKCHIGEKSEVWLEYMAKEKGKLEKALSFIGDNPKDQAAKRRDALTAKIEEIEGVSGNDKTL